jgi:hypothetical protein
MNIEKMFYIRNYLFLLGKCVFQLSLVNKCLQYINIKEERFSFVYGFQGFSSSSDDSSAFWVCGKAKHLGFEFIEKILTQCFVGNREKEGAESKISFRHASNGLTSSY